MSEKVLTDSFMNDAKKKLDDIFDECVKKQENDLCHESYDLTENQKYHVSDFMVYRDCQLFGITDDDGMRYISDGCFAIFSMAIVRTEAWKVFKELFKYLGDSWSINVFREAKRVEKLNIPDMARPFLNLWSEDMPDMDLLISTPDISIYENKEGNPIFIDSRYSHFLENSLTFCLNDSKRETDPILLTHLDSCGFAGLLMPIQVDSGVDLKARLSRGLLLLENRGEK